MSGDIGNASRLAEFTGKPGDSGRSFPGSIEFAHAGKRGHVAVHPISVVDAFQRLAGGEDIEVRALIFRRPGLLAVADREHLLVKARVALVAGVRAGAGQVGEIVGALSQSTGQQVGLVTVLLAFAKASLVIDEQHHQSAEDGGGNR
ncbi:hypothetical protein NNO07_06725 [Pseudomonas resinovorans]|uniref:Uncharacterized protein n=1 Tax=Metapseudomonas resinovorans TaxID=53412 RepID=A0ABT4Y1Q2_METRE|nr:hypothetical protein [Pseudomonas resinovorans]